MGAVNYLQTNALEIAERFIGYVREREGQSDHPLIRWWHSLCGGEESDEVPWCSSFVNGIAFQLGLERTRSKAARSWLLYGDPIDIADAVPGLDVVILQRGEGPQPPASVIKAPGHVGFFAGWDDRGWVEVCGGNQGNRVSVAAFPRERILGIRRLKPE